MNKEESKALHELVRERVKNNGENPGFILITYDGPHSAASIEGNAWDLISALSCLMDDKPEINEVIKRAAMINSLQSMRNGLKEMINLLNEEEIEEKEPTEELHQASKEN